MNYHTVIEGSNGLEYSLRGAGAPLQYRVSRVRTRTQQPNGGTTFLGTHYVGQVRVSDKDGVLTLEYRVGDDDEWSVARWAKTLADLVAELHAAQIRAAEREVTA